ncbi:hypothetical protein PR048_001238 [Dryococelus australis]|uniref:Tigger transposable element-derived protein 6 n=1 Tax=Dryococelus australis TaxID=614101 RepID=A0ABQ9IJ72_9NEOP|nr:hypothetical protein PR048_001238 [Dryococelus australis]
MEKALLAWFNQLRAQNVQITGAVIQEKANLFAVMLKWLLMVHNILERYSPLDVYNANETGLFYNLMQNRTLEIKGVTCKGRGECSKEHLIVLLCANIDGSNKVNLFVVGKWAKPRGFKGNIVQCRYNHNKKA